MVTIALHASLPSTAFETPVCVLDLDSYEAKTRFAGLESCLNSVKLDEFLKEPYAYDINNPPSNPDAYLSLKTELERRCSDFTGYDYKKSLFEDDYNPLIDLAEIMAYNPMTLSNAMLYPRRRYLIRAFIKGIIKREDRHSINGSRKCENIDFLKRK